MDINFSFTYDETWTGTLSGYARNPLTGNLGVVDQVTPSGDKARLTDYPQDPTPAPYFETPEIDLGEAGPSVISAVIQSQFSAGGAGTADVSLLVDYRTSTGSYNGFEAWDVDGNAEPVTARYIKARVVQNATDGAVVLTGFTLNVVLECRLMGYVRNPLTGHLSIVDRAPPSGLKSRLISYPQDPEPNAFYETQEIDLGQDGQVRVWADITATLLPNETGNADAGLEIDYHIDGQDYGGWRAVDVGEITARFIKGRLVQNVTDGAACIKRFTLNVDSLERQEKATGVAVPDTGLEINFNMPFFTTPNVQVTADDNSSPIAARYAVKSAISPTGFTVYVFNSAGSPVAGTVDWVASGV
jgi:hypothetical protein